MGLYESWYFVDQGGRPTGQTFMGRKDTLKANTPDGCRAVVGVLPFERRDDPQLRRERVLAQIAERERRQARPLREIVRDPANVEARRRLDEIEADIAKLRTSLET